MAGCQQSRTGMLSAQWCLHAATFYDPLAHRMCLCWAALSCSHCNIVNQMLQIRHIKYRNAVALSSPMLLLMSYIITGLTLLITVSMSICCSMHTYLSLHTVTHCQLVQLFCILSTYSSSHGITFIQTDAQTIVYKLPFLRISFVIVVTFFLHHFTPSHQSLHSLMPSSMLSSLSVTSAIHFGTNRSRILYRSA